MKFDVSVSIKSRHLWTPIILVFLVILSSSVGAAQMVNVNVGASGDNGDRQFNPSIAFNPTDTNKIIVAAFDERQGDREYIYYSADGGQTFATRGGLPYVPHVGNYRPTVIYSGNGRAWCGFSSYNTTNEYNANGIFVMQSGNNGDTWNDQADYIHKVVDHTAAGTEFEDEVSLTPSTFSIHATWTKYSNAVGSSIYYGRLGNSAANGTAFSEIKKISQTNVSAFGSSVATVASKYIYAVWLCSDGKFRSNVSTDAGNTFQSVDYQMGTAVSYLINQVDEITIGPTGE
jgi:hypothetical protein